MNEEQAIIFGFVLACAVVIFAAFRSQRKMPPPTALIIEEKSPIFGNDGKLKDDLRIEIIDGQSVVLLSAGTIGNTHKWEIFSTASDNQDAIDITLYRGTEEIAEKNFRIGKFRIIGIPPAKRGKPQIAVAFSVTDDSIQIASQDLKRKMNMYIEKAD